MASVEIVISSTVVIIYFQTACIQCIAMTFLNTSYLLIQAYLKKNKYIQLATNIAILLLLCQLRFYRYGKCIV